MKKILITWLLLPAVLMISSCEEFIETDLGKKTLTVNSPADHTVSSLYSQTFWWEELKGADHYQLQIVKPSFSSIQQFITDTLVSGSKFTYSLSPGTYQWRIRAQNANSATEYITRTLTIDTTLDLTSQPLVLSLPSDNAWSSHLTNTFSWQTMPQAENYVFQILKENILIHTSSGTALSDSYTASAEGVYQWRAFAQNSGSNSACFTRTITIDTTRPPIPALIAPLLDTITAEPVPLSWSAIEGNLNYRLLISADSNFTTFFKDTITALQQYDVYGMIRDTYYYWKVKATDKAGNSSDYFYRRRIKRN